MTTERASWVKVLAWLLGGAAFLALFPLILQLVLAPGWRWETFRSNPWQVVIQMRDHFLFYVVALALGVLIFVIIPFASARLRPYLNAALSMPLPFTKTWQRWREAYSHRSPSSGPEGEHRTVVTRLRNRGRELILAAGAVLIALRLLFPVEERAIQRYGARLRTDNPNVLPTVATGRTVLQSLGIAVLFGSAYLLLRRRGTERFERPEKDG